MDIIQCEGFGYKAEILKKIPKLQSKELVIVQGGDDTFNRLALSSKYVDILLDPHLGQRKDFMHQRNSGLNHVLCALAREHSVAIGFSFSSILHSLQRAKDLGRVIQNIHLCRKYKIPMVIGSFAKDAWDIRNEKDLQAFFKVLGMTGKEVQMEYVKKRLEYKRIFIQKGVMLAE
ncbi:MAG: RNase P subunit p30 family protein [bacterium]|nr:RNase P subunit p30 family protein [bacterium]